MVEKNGPGFAETMNILKTRQKSNILKGGVKTGSCCNPKKKKGKGKGNCRIETVSKNHVIKQKKFDSGK